MFLKKLASLSFASALVYSISLPAQAELLKNFKTDGSIEVKTFGINNETDRSSGTDDYRSDTRTRIQVGGSFDILDDVHARVQLRKNNRMYGQAVENVNSVETALAVDNAYVKIDKVFKRVDLTMGRQFYGSGDDLLIYFGAQPDDLLSVTALDIFRTDADIMGWARFTGIAGKTVEGTAVSATAPAGPTNTNTDTDLWGIDLGTDKLIPMGHLNLAYYTRKAKGGVGVDNNTLSNLSLKANGDILAGIGYGAQYVQNFGRNRAAAGTPGYHGAAYIVGLYLNRQLNEKMPIRAHAEFGHGDNDFVAIAPGKRFGKIWGEHNNVGPSSLNGVGGAGLTNLNVVDAGIGTQCPITSIGIDFNWYRFMYDVSPGNGKSAGTEYDLILSYKHSENVSLEASAATFQVGGALDRTGGVPTSPITRLGADVKIKF